MYLLDTVALSEQQRPAPDVGVERFFDSVPVALMYTSVVVLGEIWRGILGDPQVARRNRLERWFDELLVTMEAQTLPITTEVCLLWAELRVAAVGQPLPPVDALIVATAIVHNLTVVTRNVRDFQRSGALVLSPWDA